MAMKHNTLLLLALSGIAVGCEAMSAEAPSPSDTGSVKQAEPQEAEAEPQKVVRSEREWQRLLTPQQYRVLRGKGTERPFVNKYDKHFKPGTYACAACGQELFGSQTKFNSGCGWPAFYAAMAGDRVQLTPDFSHGMIRTEVTCSRCDSHLGHIFDDAPQTPTGKRYCINSVSLKFIPSPRPKLSNDEKSAPAQRVSPESKSGSSQKTGLPGRD
jgi:peptide-methionine (R)-S-oxide reductase